MESKRQQKVIRQLQKDLGEILDEMARTLFKNVMITVTKVNVTPDLSKATTYISLFAAGNNKGVLKEIRIRNTEIRRELGNRIRHQFRIVPELEFYEDDSLDYIENIEKLLDE